MKNIIYQVISLVAIVAYFVPIAIVIIKRLWSVLPFLLFGLYWLLGGMVNMIEFIHLPKRAIELITVFYNMLDMLAVLVIFYYSTASATIKKYNRMAAPLYAVLVIVNSIVFGLHYNSLKYLLGAGLLLVLVSILWEIIVYLQKIKHTAPQKGLLLIYAAMLFEYGTYVVIYIFDYYLPGVSSSRDNFFVYYISSIVALAVAVTGFLTRGITDRKHLFEKSFNRKVTEYSLQNQSVL